MKHRSRAIVSALVALVVACLCLPAAASAAPPPLFTQVPEDGLTGEAAGRFVGPEAVAAQPAPPGHVYVADRGRIDEFTAWGGFVKAWGWGVRDGASELQTCTEQTGCRGGLSGSGTGEVGATAIAVDAGGDLYEANQFHRVQKFDPEGNFLLSFGGDVVAEGPDNSSNDETQELRIAATAGTFRLALKYNPFTDAELFLSESGKWLTPPLPYNATAAEVESALDALYTIGGLGGSVRVSGGPGDATGTSPYRITFEGTLSGNNVPQLELNGEALTLPVGAQLDCSTTTTASSVSYRWLRNGSLISGATAPTYTTTAADAGKGIQCEVVASDGEIGLAGTSRPVQLIAPAPAVAPPTLSSFVGINAPEGSPAVGGSGVKLGCEPHRADWTGSPSFAYSWYRNGELIAGAEEETFQVSASELTSPAGFQCAVTGTNAGGSLTVLARYTVITNGSGSSLRELTAGFATLNPAIPSEVTTPSQGGGPEICRAGGGDVCKVGARGNGSGEFSEEGHFGKLAVSPTTGVAYIGEGERIQAFEADGAFKEAIQMPAGKQVAAVGADSAGKLYVAFEGQAEVQKMEPHGPTAQFLAPQFHPESSGERPDALALDGSGNLYALEGQGGGEPARVQEFDASGKCLTCGSEGEAEEVEEGGKKVTKQGGFDRSSPKTQLESIAAGGGCGVDAAYAVTFGPNVGTAYLRAYGEHPDPVLCEPPKEPPSIDDQYAFAVETTEATVKAKVNPHFWAGSIGSTHYYVQYATRACLEEGGWEASCAAQTPAPPGAALHAGVVNEGVPVAVTLTGLQPGTAYRFRFVAEGSGAPGEPVIGRGGQPGAPGTDSTFTTYRPAEAERCPANEAFRTGPAALLPDCRAYEMVSPIDKEGGDVVALKEFQTQLPATLSVSATSGGRFAYGSTRSFGDAESAPFTTQYVAARHEGEGWVTHAISPPRGKNVFEKVAFSFDTEFKLLSPDLCEGWLESYAEMPGGPPAPAGVADLYRRTDNECGGPSYEALNAEQPPVASGEHSEEFQIELQGVSEDGAKAVFQANDKLAEGGTEATLTPEGSDAGPKQLYGAQEGQERFLCILPGGEDWTGPCTAGGGGNSRQGRSREGNVAGALSAAGSRLYWTASVEAPGRIYLRLNPFGSGSECAKASAPCTLEVSQAAEEEAAPAGSRFWAAARDGSRALFTVGSLEGGQARLYEYRLADHSTHPIAARVRGLVGQSADASRAYLVSEEARGGANAEGKSATAGEPNLYLYESQGESLRFVATLAAGDVAGLSAAALSPRHHNGRVSADGEAAAFMSSASLTGYDNTDVASGKADAEVYLYEATANEGQGKLVCASCNPSGARPRGVRVQEGDSHIEAAAKLAVPENMFYASRALAEDGRRLFFESYDPLTPRDTNGQKDVYEWEAPEEGSCTTTAPTYSPADGGCVELISSGKSPIASEFMDATPSGSDAFFATAASLVPQDPGLVDVYDAREGGGLPSPPGLPASCEGEACQAPPEAPNDPTPASSAFEGAGNVREAAPRKKRRHHRHHRRHAKKRARHSRGRSAR